MDPIALAASIVPLLAAYLGHVGEHAAQQLGDEIGRAAIAKLASLYDRVKAVVTGDPEAEVLLGRLERRPNDDRRRDDFEERLAEVIRTDQRIAEELERAVADAYREGGPTLSQVVQSGAVAIRGKVIQRGTYVAGRDIRLG